MTTENNKDEGGNPSYETDLLNVGPRPFLLRDGAGGFLHNGNGALWGLCFCLPPLTTQPLQSMAFGSGKLTSSLLCTVKYYPFGGIPWWPSD